MRRARVTDLPRALPRAAPYSCGVSRALPPRRVIAAIGAASIGALVLLQCSQRPPPLTARTPADSDSTRSAPVAKVKRVYGGVVVVRTGASAILDRAARDLARILSAATEAPFRLEPASTQGIFLVRSDASDAPPDLVTRLQGESREAYAIQSRGDGRLLIVANGDEGLAFGAYQYLESLGVRFYFPSERWTILPSLDSIERLEDRVVKPAFRLRQFVGTGGLGKGLAMDPNGELAGRWDLWKRRNGFGEQFHIDGHSGEAFNVRHKETLLANPEYLASVGGKRVAWTKTAKLDPSNQKALDLFVQDRLQAYRQKKARDPDGPGSFAVSVEPADGGGHCDSPACEGLGSVSDRQFLVANRVARALNAEFPGAKASLFAYNLHADIPSIEIDPQVYVTLVPYAFQRTGAEPEEFIAQWSKKKSPVSIYDYWSIPDWVADQPVFDYLTTPAKKLRLWRRYGVEGLLGESTYSAGAMGLGWYIAGHLMWEPEADPKALAEEFYRKCFERAQGPMRRMLERWASGFSLNSVELHASFADLDEAFALAPSPEVSLRLADYAGYLQYLRLRLEWQLATKDDAEQKKRSLVEHLWRTYESAMLDTYRLQQLLLRKDEVLGPIFDPTRPNLPVWRTLAPATLLDAKRWSRVGARDFPSLGFERRSFTGELTRVAAGTTSLSSPPAAPLTLVGSNRMELTVPAGLPTIGIVLRVRGELRLQLRGQDSALITTLQLAPSSAPQTIMLSVPAPGSYTLDLRTAKNAQTSLVFPSEVGVELSDFRIPKGVPVPDLYFFLPIGEKALGVIDPIALPSGSGVVVLDSHQHEIPLERRDGGRLLVARVPAGEDGRVWTLRRAVAPDAALLLINAPQRLALSPSALQVPASARKPARGSDSLNKER